MYGHLVAPIFLEDLLIHVNMLFVCLAGKLFLLDVMESCFILTDNEFSDLLGFGRSD